MQRLRKLRQDIVSPSSDLLNEFYRRIAKHCKDKPKSITSRFFLRIKQMPEDKFYRMITVMISLGLIAEGLYLFIVLYL